MKILLFLSIFLFFGCSNDATDTLNAELNKLESKRLSGKEKLHQLGLKARDSLNSEGNRNTLEATKNLQKEANKILFEIVLNHARIQGTLYAIDEKCGYRKERRLEAHSEAQNEIINNSQISEVKILQIEKYFWSQESKIRSMLSNSELGSFCSKYTTGA